jgi:pyruvate kinase
MLHSMITSNRPTRAEVSDIATAVMSGSDAVMLSDETAIGEHPVEAVRYLSRIAHHAEQVFEFEEYELRLRDSDRAPRPDAVAYAACAAAIKVQAKAIITCTETGMSARLAAKYRPQQPLYGVSQHSATLRRMSLYWGVIPIICNPSSTHTDEVQTGLNAVQERERLPNGSVAVVTGGTTTGQAGSTSVMQIAEMNAATE